METTNDNSLGKRIEHIRGSESQVSFAKKLGIHKNTLGNYERGTRSPDADFFNRIAQIGINTHWLITGAGNMLISDTSDTVSDEKGVYLSEKPKELEDKTKHQVDDAQATKLKAGTKFMLKSSHDDESVWSVLIIELMAAHGLSEEGGRRIIETLAELEQRKQS